MSHIKIPYEDLKKVNEPYFDEFILRSTNVIKSGWYVLGSEVSNFELEFSKVNDSIYCLGVASGLDALILGLQVFNFPKYSEVLVPSNTYIASVLAIIKAGLKPILVEPDPYTFNITLDGIKKMYTKDCVAILPVHLYGRLCPMEEIMDFAEEKGLKVIEDCAQSHFSSINGVKAGNFGDIGAFSFYPTKNLGALGDAGAIVCKDIEIFNKLKALRNYGSEKKYFNKYLGINSRLDEIQACFLSVKLKDYQSVIIHKRKLAKIYLENLKDIASIQLPLKANENHVWHIFNIIVDNRDKLKEFLLLNGIATEIHYPITPIQQEGYQGLFKGVNTPISMNIHNKTLSLPISICHSIEEIRYVCEVIIKYFKKKSLDVL